MIRNRSRALALVGSLFAVGIASDLRAQVDYLHDDGTAENTVGVGIDGGDWWWANAFDVVAGGEVVTRVELAFAVQHNYQTGNPFLVLLYEDTDDNGDPADGLVLLRSVAGTVASAGSPAFQSVDIPNVEMSGGFFVAVLMSLGPFALPSSIDTAASQGQSWFAFSSLGAFDETAPALHSPALIDTFIAGNWLLRATGIPADGDEDGDGVVNADDLCDGTVVPENVPIAYLGTNRFALIDADEVFDTTSPRGRGPTKSFTLAETRGCSCEQIVRELELGEGHLRFGCSLSAMRDWIARFDE